MKALFGSVAILALLAGCGGGGGGGGGGSSPVISSNDAATTGNGGTSTTGGSDTGNGGTTTGGDNGGGTTPPPSNTTQTFNMSATTTHLGGPSTDQISPGTINQSDAGDAGTVTVVTDPDGHLVSLSFNASHHTGTGPAANGPMDLTGLDGVTVTNPDASLVTGSVTAANLSTDGSNAVAQTVSDGTHLTAADIANAVLNANEDPNHPLALVAQGMSYATFGVWSLNDKSTGLRPIGAFAVGSETPAGAMPTTGSATYSGTAAGFASAPNPNFGKGETNQFQTMAFDGAATLSADFGKQSVAASFTNMKTQRVDEFHTTGTLPDLAGTGSIAGNKFAVGNLAGGGLAGTANGAFYGPAANEAAGTFQATTSGACPTAGCTSIIGAFGVHK